MEIEIKKHDKVMFLLASIFLLAAAFIYVPKINSDRTSNMAVLLQEKQSREDVKNTQTAESVKDAQNIEQNSDKQSSEDAVLAQKIYAPMENVSMRVNKKPFGILITPKNSPVSPERFSGYHTAIDLEILPQEVGMDVVVKSACSGKILLKESAGGYGGVVAQLCEVDGNPATVVYGHMKLSSVEKNTGDELAAGEKLGFLGDAYSFETDGERKHLHFGIHKGNEVNILGYVQKKDDLLNWIDPCSYLCGE